jgi:DUF4097 and DUF4098 domain-containing protein YvlB
LRIVNARRRRMIMKSMKSKGLAVALSLAFVLALGTVTAAAEEKYEEKFERTEALARDGMVYLSNVSGDIEVKTWNEASVKIEALKTSRAATEAKAKENAALVTIEVTKEGSVLRIETKYPERRRSWGNNQLNVSVSYKLWIPEKASFEGHSVSGDVAVDPLGGKCDINAVSGDVEILGAQGLEVTLVSGELNARDISGDAYLNTVSGDIRAERIRGSVTTETVSGDIDLLEISEARSVDAKTVSGDITYRGDVRPDGQYRMRAHSGDIEMVIPAGSEFDFEAKTFNGTVDTAFEIKVIGKISPKDIKGTVGNGGATIRLNAFSGNIDLRKK